MYKKKHTEETRKKMRENHADFSGENNPMYNKHHTKETCEKISCAHKKDYARVIKKGFTSNGKQLYALKHNEKKTKYSINKEKLEKLADEINKENNINNS